MTLTSLPTELKINGVRYSNIKEINQGGMAKIYTAESEGTARLAALKEAFVYGADDYYERDQHGVLHSREGWMKGLVQKRLEKAREQLREEVQLSSKLGNDTALVVSWKYYCEEYGLAVGDCHPTQLNPLHKVIDISIRENDLDEVIYRFGLVDSLLTALSKLHHWGEQDEKSVLHCDLSAGNVYFEDNSVFLGDFGSHRKIGTQQRLPLNSGVATTPSYAAPELDHSPTELGRGTDLYSVTVILMQLLCGQAFSLENFKDLAGR